MAKRVNIAYIDVLKNELKKGLTIVNQKLEIQDELRKLADAIQKFAQGQLKLFGVCKILSVSTSCIVSGLKPMGETYEVIFCLHGLPPIRFLSLTYSTNGVYPCSVRSENSVALCKNLKEIQCAFADVCKTSGFRIVEYAQTAKTTREITGRNVAAMGGVGSNPNVNTLSHAKQAKGKRQHKRHI